MKAQKKYLKALIILIIFSLFLILPNFSPVKADEWLPGACPPENPCQSPPLREDQIPEEAIRLYATPSGFSPRELTVEAGQVVILVVKAIRATHSLRFDDPELSNIYIGVALGETRGIVFYAPQTGGDYTFYCAQPGHRERGEVGVMHVITPDTTPPEISNPMVEPATLQVGEELTVKATITDESEIVSVKANLGDLATIDLFDDGLHDDDLAGDHLYADSWIVAEGTKAGDYLITITAVDEFNNQLEDSSLGFKVWEAIDVAVILAEPSGSPHNTETKVYQPCKLLEPKQYPGFNKDYYQDLAYCVTDYYKENSYGAVDLNFEIFDNNGEWYKLLGSVEDYRRVYGGNAENKFTEHTITKTEEDFSAYDIVSVIHSGDACTKKEEDSRLCSMTWSPVVQPLGSPPYKFIIAETSFTGTWAHEIGHILGELIIPTPDNTMVPDLYNMGLLSKWWCFDSEACIEITKEGRWDLMATGSRSGDPKGSNPPHMSSYTKEFLQWLKYENTPVGEWTDWIESLTTSKLGDKVYRYPIKISGGDISEYYILEARNRNLTTWDSSLPEERALVLYYVDTKGYSEYGYDQFGMMFNQYRSITIPGTDFPEYLINDGILSPTGETYRDMDNLIKFSALSDRIVNGKYEIQAKVAPITFDSFEDKLVGGILKPSLFFRNQIKFPSLWAQSDELNLSSKNTIILGEVPLDIITKGPKITIIKFLIIIVILSSLLLLWILIKIIPRYKKESVRKIAKIIIKILLVISLIIAIYLIYSLIITYQIDESPPEGGFWEPPVDLTVEPDLDLHLYTDDGKHIGMNYETGEYEIQIPGAIVSGDNQGAPEWIYVPENVTNYHFVVSSYDNQKFLEENPEIAEEIEDKTDSYEVYARYIDPEIGFFDSTSVAQDIEPGDWLDHEVSGDIDISVSPGIPFDTIPPTTTASLSGILGQNNWYTSDVSVVLSAIDNPGGSGIEKIEYQIKYLTELSNNNAFHIALKEREDNIILDRQILPNLNSNKLLLGESVSSNDSQVLGIVRTIKSGPSFYITKPWGKFEEVEYQVLELEILESKNIHGELNFTKEYVGKILDVAGEKNKIKFLKPGDKIVARVYLKGDPDLGGGGGLCC